VPELGRRGAARLAGMIEYFESVARLEQQLEKVPPGTTTRLLKTKGRLRKVLDMILPV
jgi:hypothetical protein